LAGGGKEGNEKGAPGGPLAGCGGLRTKRNWTVLCWLCLLGPQLESRRAVRDRPNPKKTCGLGEDRENKKGSRAGGTHTRGNPKKNNSVRQGNFYSAAVPRAGTQIWASMGRSAHSTGPGGGPLLVGPTRARPRGAWN